MKSYKTLALKELFAQKVTSILILTAIILSTIATTVIGQSIGILQSMRIDQATSLNGDRYVTIYELNEEQNAALFSDSRLTEVGSKIHLGNVELKNSGLTMTLTEYQGNTLDKYPSNKKIKEGRLPDASGEIALPEDVLRYLGFEGKIGDKITLSFKPSLLVEEGPPYIMNTDFILTGILEDNHMGYVSGSVTGLVGEGTAAEILPERYYLYATDFKIADTKEFQSIVNDIAEKLDVEERYIQYNWVLLDALGISYDKKKALDKDLGFPFMMTACILVGALILSAAGLVIYNILKVSITKRIREYGTLRAIGCERKQLYRLVTAQLLILCGPGIPIGVLSGGFLSKGILTIVTSMLNPELFLVENTQELNAAIAENSAWKLFPLLTSIVITLLFAILSSFPAARYASSVSPVIAMNGKTVTVKRRNRRQKKIRKFEAYYARLNLKRSPGRSAITILSMIMSITVFISLQSFSGLLDTSRDIQNMHLGDYAVTNETIGFSKDDIEKILNLSSVASLSTAKLSVYYQDENGLLPVKTDFTLNPSETLQIGSMDKNSLNSYVPGLSKQDLKDLQNGTGCLVKNPIPFAYEGISYELTELKPGDNITVNGKKLRVIAVTDRIISINNNGFVNGVQLIVSDEAYDEITGQTVYSEIYPVLSEGADAEDFEARLEELCKDIPGTHWLSYLETDSQLSESYEQIRLLCQGLILFMGLIGILNIINTVYTNIHTRVNEIGMQRAIGMSTFNLYKTFLWEGVYYGLIASLIGAVSGYICTVLIEAAANESLQLTAFPLLSVAEAAVVSVAACIIATAVPLRSIAKMSIVESIETVE